MALTTTKRAITALGCTALGIAAFAGCAPANVAGDYTVAVTSQANGCNIPNWTTGASSTGVDFLVTQSGGTATGTVQGLAGLFIGATLGSNIFNGSVTGNGVDLTLHGTTTMHQGGCAYTVNGEVRGTLTGDSLQGSITYTSSTNGSPDCGAIDGCTSVQDFSGSRPPSSH